jgi:hypothetical protein
MSVSARERFLASNRNGVLSIAEPDGGVVASPVWFLYEPGGDITLHLSDPSLKLTALQRASTATLTVQDEGDITGSGRPPRYVSVTGPVIEDRAFDLEVDGEEIWQSIVKYLGAEIAQRYVDLGGEGYLTGDGPAMPRVVRIRPRRWFTRDYGNGGEKWDEIVGINGAAQLTD